MTEIMPPEAVHDQLERESTSNGEHVQPREGTKSKDQVLSDSEKNDIRDIQDVLSRFVPSIAISGRRVLNMLICIDMLGNYSTAVVTLPVRRSFVILDIGTLFSAQFAKSPLDLPGRSL